MPNEQSASPAVQRAIYAIEQTRRRLGQAAFDGRVPDKPLCAQMAKALGEALQILVSSPQQKGASSPKTQEPVA